MKDKKIGMAVVLGASIMWAIEPTLAKLSYQTTSHLDTFATRSVFSLLTIGAYLLVVRRNGLCVKMRYLPKLIYVSLVATLFADLMYIFALTKVAVTNAVFIGHMQPIFIVFMGFILLKEDRITRFDYLGILSMMVAGLLVTSKTLSNLLSLKIGTLGDLYVLLATIAWATTAVVVRKYLRQLHAGIIAFYRFFFATVIFVIYMITTDGIDVANIYQILLGVVIGAGTIMYYEGLRLIKAAQVSALELSTPFFATVFGIVVLKEYITPMQFCGFLFLISGMYFLSRRERE
ncbi:MAG: DMT family transporter [candidate division WOR-3 bacterium]|nr:MAG: DMT family transporter [candidate division WOR-3 bacterium]